MILFGDRLFEFPFQAHYGAARRCLRAMQAAFPDLDALDEAFRMEWGENWDDYFGYLLDAGTPEDVAVRELLQRAIIAYEAR